MRGPPLLALALTGLLAGSASARAASIDLEITGVEVDGAPVIVGLFDSASALPHAERAARTVTLPASQSTLRVHVDDLAPGSWGVTVHHDQNGDGKLNFRWFPPGPSEGTSASCPRRPLAMPTWGSCSFALTEGGALTQLVIWY